MSRRDNNCWLLSTRLSDVRGFNYYALMLMYIRYIGRKTLPLLFYRGDIEKEREILPRNVAAMLLDRVQLRIDSKANTPREI